MILCLLGMFLSDTGVPGAGDIVRGSSISLERLKNNVELISTGQIQLVLPKSGSVRFGADFPEPWTGL